MPPRSPRDRFRIPPRAVALIVATALGQATEPPARADGPSATSQKDKKKGFRTLFGPRDLPMGTLGYGPPGPVPGYPGFGLKYGMGYGFGGSGLGTQANGGYPFYGGPGYPHAAPELRRIGGIVPFSDFGGPGGPTPSCPNFFAPTGPLAPDQPVLDIPNPTGDDYGCYTGTVPYAEEVFAPFSTSDDEKTDQRQPSGETDSIDDAPTTPPPPPPPPPGAPGAPRAEARPQPDPATAPASATVPVPAIPTRSALGIEVIPTAPTDPVRGLRVTRIVAGRAAAAAGLAPGDLIEAANGYATERPADLDWVITRATPGPALDLTIRTARAGESRVVSARVR